MVMRGTTAAPQHTSLTRVKVRGRVARCTSLLAVTHLLASWGCASRAPLSPSAEGAVNGSPQSQTAAVESAARMQNCSAGTADCDGNAANACEAVLTQDANNCGACGVRCAAANGESSCFAGTCRMVHCIPGHCDLDRDPKNGCEARTKGCRIKIQ